MKFAIKSKSPLMVCHPLSKLWELWFFWWILQHYTKNAYGFWSKKGETFLVTHFVYLEILKNFDSINISWISVKEGGNFLGPILSIWKFWKTFTALLHHGFPSKKGETFCNQFFSFGNFGHFLKVLKMSSPRKDASGLLSSKFWGLWWKNV